MSTFVSNSLKLLGEVHQVDPTPATTRQLSLWLIINKASERKCCRTVTGRVHVFDMSLKNEVVLSFF